MVTADFIRLERTTQVLGRMVDLFCIRPLPRLGPPQRPLNAETAA